MYSTETAEKLGEYWNGLSKSDFKHITEELYRKRTGEFFLYGEGGPLSPYALTEWGERYGSEQIKPLTMEQAQAWAEEKLTSEEYEAIFGEVSEDGTKTQLCISCTAAELELIKRKAAAAGLSVSAFVLAQCLE